MARWMIGDIGVDRIAEIEGPMFPPKEVFPDFDPEVLQRHRDDLIPRYYAPDLGLVIGTIQTYVIRAGAHNVLVDTCCGNDKQRPGEPPFHNLHTPYLERLEAIGLRADDIHFVLCTHLHVDHVGWNTKLDSGRWIPTFPNATYLFSQADLDYLIGVANLPPPENSHGLQYADSIEPILASRRARLLTAGETLVPGLEIDFAPGHTPGHVTLRATSGRDAALFIGDIVQHPFQVYRPAWNSAFCASPEQARATRRRILGECADQDLLMFPAHFADPYAVKIRRNEESFAITQ